LLPEALQHLIGEHTFFALIAALLLLLFAFKARAALIAVTDPVVPAPGLGVRNIAELGLQLVMSQSDAIIGKQGRKYVPFFATFFLFHLAQQSDGTFTGIRSTHRQFEHDFGSRPRVICRLQRHRRP
jgi:hypothetical protein